MMDTGFTYDVNAMFPKGKLGRFGDGPVRKTSFFNAHQNPITTQNRELIAHPLVPTGLTQLKDDLFMFIDATQGNSKNSHQMYGFIADQIPLLGRIDTVRIDMAPNVPSDPANPNANEEPLILARNLARELNAASETHCKRWKPKNYDVLDVLFNEIDRFFFVEYRKWQAMTKRKYGLAGLIKYSPVAKWNLGAILNSNPVLHGGDFTTHLSGKLDVANVWYYETGVQPRLENHLGFMIKLVFNARDDEPGIIDVIPNIVPVFCEEDEKRLDIMDYYCGTVSFNRNTDIEQKDTTGPNTTIQVNVNVT